MENMDAYRKKIEAQLKEWNAKIEELKAKSEKLGADAKVEYAEQIEALRKGRDKLKAKLGDMSEGSDEAWHAFKSGVEKAAHEFKTGLNQAAEILRKEGKKDSEDKSAESDVCIRAAVPEHARFDSDDMGCDDGREGKID